MTPENWPTWFQAWLARHPLRQPPEFLGRDYTEQVLIRIKETRPSPLPAFRWWLPRPRFSFALGTAVACALGVLVLLNSSDRSDTDVNETLDILEQVEPNDLLSFGEDPVSDDDLLKELQTPDETDLSLISHGKISSL